MDWLTDVIQYENSDKSKYDAYNKKNHIGCLTGVWADFVKIDANQLTLSHPLYDCHYWVVEHMSCNREPERAAPIKEIAKESTEQQTWEKAEELEVERAENECG